MNWFDNYRQQNQHLFGEDSDFSDTEEDFEPEENEEIEIEESQETEDYEALNVKNKKKITKIISSSCWYSNVKEILKKNLK